MSLYGGCKRVLFLGPELLQNLILELLEALWSHPKALGSFPRTLGGILERSWRLLESSWSVYKGVSRLGESSRRAQGDSGNGPGRGRGGDFIPLPFG